MQTQRRIWSEPDTNVAEGYCRRVRRSSSIAFESLRGTKRTNAYNSRQVRSWRQSGHSSPPEFQVALAAVMHDGYFIFYAASWVGIGARSDGPEEG
jgi:hypothetical protein